jgi:hypothetical protein
MPCEPSRPSFTRSHSGRQLVLCTAPRDEPVIRPFLGRAHIFCDHGKVVENIPGFSSRFDFHLDALTRQCQCQTPGPKGELLGSLCKPHLQVAPAVSSFATSLRLHRPGRVSLDARPSNVVRQPLPTFSSPVSLPAAPAVQIHRLRETEDNCGAGLPTGIPREVQRFSRILLHRETRPRGSGIHRRSISKHVLTSPRRANADLLHGTDRSATGSPSSARSRHGGVTISQQPVPPA